MATVLVSGASGFVGSHVVPVLLAREHRVRAIVRSESSARRVLERLPDDARELVSPIALELTAPDATERLSRALDGADAAVHLAAIPRDHSQGRDLDRVNAGGTQAVIAAARQAGVRRFIHVGALGVEERPGLRYATSKARAESAVAASGLDATILRPSVMWGERDGFFNIIADLVRTAPGLVPIPGRGRTRFQPLWVGDLALAIGIALERSSFVGRSIDMGGPRHWTYREIVDEVIRTLGLRRRPVPIPVPLIRLVAGTAERIGLGFPIATDQLRQLGLDNTTGLGSVRDAFDFEPRDMAGNLGYLRRRRPEQEPADQPGG